MPHVFLYLPLYYFTVAIIYACFFFLILERYVRQYVCEGMGACEGIYVQNVSGFVCENNVCL